MSNALAMAIITDSKKANVHITKTLRAYSKVMRDLHVAAVSAIWHTAKSGNPVLLNRLHHGLRPNDQQALRLFIRRASAIIGLDGEAPDGRHAEVIQAAVDRGKVVDFMRGEFRVVVEGGHTSDQAKALLSMCEERFINPEDPDKEVFDRNNFAEVQVLTDSDALDAVISAANRALEGNTDRREVKIGGKTKALLEDIKSKAEQMKSQYDLSDGDEDKPKRQTRPKGNKGSASAPPANKPATAPEIGATA